MRKPRRPARTVRQRFTALYGALFLLSAVGLLAVTYLVASGPSSTSRAAPMGEQPYQPSALAAAQEHIARLQAELAQAEAHQSRQLLLGSAVALAVMAVVSIVLGRFVAGRVLRPLRAITATTRRISADNLHERLAVNGPADEVKDLADTIDGLLERLEGSFAAQRRFVADASHELRTPLATMRASLDVAVGKPVPVPEQTVSLAGRLRTELDQVDRLLDGLLVLARAQHGAMVDREAVSLGAAVTAALEARAAGIEAKSLTVRTDLGDVWTRGSHTLLSRMVDNVIDNAVRHNGAGGWIRVAVTAAAGTALLVVETGGDVLDQEQVALLARPFQRLGQDRVHSGDGSGLGLAIVAAVAAAHGGDLDLSARPAGGLRVAVTLPAAGAPE